ncbi:MAG: hypothetical protein KH152_09390, partial [Finegoldia magna]|nr:hypothetical protein [Finegoldia magna]
MGENDFKKLITAEVSIIPFPAWFIMLTLHPVSIARDSTSLYIYIARNLSYDWIDLHLKRIR